MDLDNFPISGDGGEGLQAGINVDAYSDVDVFIQGGVLGPVGFHGAHTASVAATKAAEELEQLHQIVLSTDQDRLSRQVVLHITYLA